MNVAVHTDNQAPMLLPGAVRVSEAEERVARRALMDQIARLERDLAQQLVDAFPAPAGLPLDLPRGRGARILSLGELEELRDELVERLRSRAAAREKLVAMIAAPAEHRGAVVTLRELGEQGCGKYVVKPRLGLIGRLSGWWHIKLSSGCPLAPLGQALPQARRPRRRTLTRACA